MRATQPERREAFTLIELLVVISIIAILMALSLAGAQAVRARGLELQARNDIAQLTTAMESFKTDFAMSYPPPSTMTLEADGYHPYLRKMFPRASTPNASVAGITLNGDQILVLMLGGPDGLGWSKDPSNPYNTNPAVGRRKPNFDFPTRRLINGSGGGGGTFRAFADPYGRAYAYFGSGFAGNDYGSPNVLGTTPSIETSSPLKYFNSHSFQIISAGKDSNFGPGGLLTPGSGSYATMSPGADDLSNFWPSKLGVAR